MLCCRRSCGERATWRGHRWRPDPIVLCDHHAAQIAGTDTLDPLEITMRQRVRARDYNRHLKGEVA